MRGKAGAALACMVMIVAAGPAVLVTSQATAQLAQTAEPAQAAALVTGRAGTLAGHGKPARNPPAYNPPPPTSQTLPRPTANCQPQAANATRLPEVQPWAQQALQFSSVWGFTRGQKVTVAVVDSGVDYTSQLVGRVTSADLTNTGFGDCVGHGTAVASIIAASDQRTTRGIPFYGVAPAAHILSIKVSAGETSNTNLLARGITYAVDHNAGVINVSICASVDSRALHMAVVDAQNHNAVVVAAAGNDGQQYCSGGGPYYPASYPGVVSVAAIDNTGTVTSNSGGRLTPVSVAAPGVGVDSDWPGGYSTDDTGTSFATAFVSGEAALIRSAFPTWTAAQVVNRIVATADGTTGTHSGAGTINPVQAVTAVLPPQTTAAPATGRPVSIPAVPRANSFARTVAVSVAGGGFAAALLVMVIAVVLPRGRRRGWRPGRVDLKAIGAAPAEPGSGWGEPEPPKRRGSHARGAPTGAEVATRPAAHARPR